METDLGNQRRRIEALLSLAVSLLRGLYSAVIGAAVRTRPSARTNPPQRRSAVRLRAGVSMSGPNNRSELTEEWSCCDCGHTETAHGDELAGRDIRKTVGEGRRLEVIETVVSPECYSENWHSQGVRDLVGCPA